jgi:hypothetical protein
VTTLTTGQMETYAALAGLPNPALWAAIGKGESGGRTDVVNSIGCVGWLQINQPVHVKAHPTWTVAWLKNPLNNARAAKVIYDAQGLGAWEAYTNGSYLKYYSGASSASSGGAATATQADSWWGGSSLDQGQDLLDQTQTGQLFTALGNAGKWMSNPHNWIRVVYVVAGGAAIIAGLAIMAQPTVTSVAGAVTPAGRALKSVGGKIA